MVVCGSYMHKFSVSKDMEREKKKETKKNNDKRRKEMAGGKMVAHLCLTLIINKLKIS
jgi:hypothetical protein